MLAEICLQTYCCNKLISQTDYRLHLVNELRKIVPLFQNTFNFIENEQLPAIEKPNAI